MRLDLAPAMAHTTSTTSTTYQLTGFVAHHGANVLSGHYTAFVRAGASWMHADDDKVKACSEAAALAATQKKDVYILFYTRDVPMGATAEETAPAVVHHGSDGSPATALPEGHDGAGGSTAGTCISGDALYLAVDGSKVEEWVPAPHHRRHRSQRSCKRRREAFLPTMPGSLGGGASTAVPAWSGVDAGGSPVWSSPDAGGSPSWSGRYLPSGYPASSVPPTGVQDWSWLLYGSLPARALVLGEGSEAEEGPSPASKKRRQ